MFVLQPEEMIKYYWGEISENGQLEDALDVVKSQTRAKAFDYTFNTVEGADLCDLMNQFQFTIYFQN